VTKDRSIAHGCRPGKRKHDDSQGGYDIKARLRDGEPMQFFTRLETENNHGSSLTRDLIVEAKREGGQSKQRIGATLIIMGPRTL
jgi:hypothetical protein